MKSIRFNDCIWNNREYEEELNAASQRTVFGWIRHGDRQREQVSCCRAGHQPPRHAKMTGVSVIHRHLVDALRKRVCRTVAPPRPSSFVLHPSSFILHPSSFVLRPFHFRVTVCPLVRRIRWRISRTLMVDNTRWTGRPLVAAIWSMPVGSDSMQSSTFCS